MRQTMWTRTEGGGNGSNPGVDNAGPWEEDTERRPVDTHNLGGSGTHNNAWFVMPAMH